MFRDVLKDHETLYDVKNRKGEWIKLTLWGIAQKTLSRNGFFAMYEPILLARMLDDDREIRKAAFKEIKAAMKWLGRQLGRVRNFTAGARGSTSLWESNVAHAFVGVTLVP